MEVSVIIIALSLIYSNDVVESQRSVQVDTDEFAIKRIKNEEAELLRKCRYPPLQLAEDREFEREILRLRNILKGCTMMNEKHQQRPNRVLPSKTIKDYLRYLEWQDKNLARLQNNLSCKSTGQVQVGDKPGQPSGTAGVSNKRGTARQYVIANNSDIEGGSGQFGIKKGYNTSIKTSRGRRRYRKRKIVKRKRIVRKERIRRRIGRKRRIRKRRTIKRKIVRRTRQRAIRGSRAIRVDGGSSVSNRGLVSSSTLSQNYSRIA